MTTKAAADLYLAQHRYKQEGRQWAVYNPNSRSVEELPVIYGFNNGGSDGWYEAMALAEDGAVLGMHVCSAECYMESDLGVLEGTRKDRHEKSYQVHYPDGYRMVFVTTSEIAESSGLQAAFTAAKKMIGKSGGEPDEF